MNWDDQYMDAKEMGHFDKLSRNIFWMKWPCVFLPCMSLGCVMTLSISFPFMVALLSKPFNSILSLDWNCAVPDISHHFPVSAFGLKDTRTGVGIGPCKEYILRICLINYITTLNSTTYITVNEQKVFPYIYLIKPGFTKSFSSLSSYMYIFINFHHACLFCSFLSKVNTTYSIHTVQTFRDKKKSEPNEIFNRPHRSNFYGICDIHYWHSLHRSKCNHTVLRMSKFLK